MAASDPTIRILMSLKEFERNHWDRLANPGWRLTPGGSLERGSIDPIDTKSEDQARSEKPCKNNALKGAAESASEPRRRPPDSGESISQESPFNPFISHDFLWSLEESGCVCADTGWLPCHLALGGDDGTPAGVVPAYLKSHSQGEYVFDHGWADGFERAGGQYYPKLQISVPFTPATGRRLLVPPGDDADRDRAVLAAGIKAAAAKFDASSAHLTFIKEEEATFLSEHEFLHRTDQQFHWRNGGYRRFDDFLGELAARKRKTIRRERRDASASGIEIDWVTGADLTEDHWDAFYRFYMDTGSRKWGYPYLNRLFFSLVGERLAGRILLVLARRNGEIIAGALNFIGSDTLYGRYWGTTENLPFLHFEVCYYQAIEFAIAQGLKFVEAGAQGPHKLARGYLPVTTHSAHHIVHTGFRDAVARYLEHEREAVSQESEMMTRFAPFRRQ